MDELNAAFWTNRRVLVTGATGLLGGCLVGRLLDAGAEVVCLVRDSVPDSEFQRSGLVSRCSVVHGDICDAPLVERTLGEYHIRSVFHLAAQTQVGVAVRNPIETFEVNIAGTWRVLEGCRNSPSVEQVVVASSDKAYGSQDVLPYDEALPMQGRAPYDVSKSCAALLAFAYAETYGVPVCVTMCGNFFGPGDLNWGRIVPGTIRAALRDEAPVIRSDGKPIRDYFYVKDGAAAYCRLVERMAEMPEIHGQAFNFSNERQIAVLDLVQTILRLMKKEHLVPVIQDEVTNEIRQQYLAAGKARRMLGWRPIWELESALLETIAWYRDLLA